MSTTMDAKQLTENGRQLIKAFDGGDPPSTLLTLLSPLEKWQPTEELLRSSKVGVAVARLRGSKDPKVAGLASQLVNKWKAAVGKKKPSGASPTLGHPAGKSGGANGVVNGRSGTSSPAPKKEAVPPPPTSAPKKYSVAPEKRNAKEDGVDTALTNNSTRDGCIQLIYNGLAFMSEEAPSDILAVSRSVEQAAYTVYAPETSATYKQKMRSLHLNLKMKHNAALRRDVFSGAIEPDRFVKMSGDELKSDQRRKSDANLEKDNMMKSMQPTEEKSISKTYVLSPQYPISLKTSRQPSRKSTDRERPHALPSCIASHHGACAERVEYGVFFAFSTRQPSSSSAPTIHYTFTFPSSPASPRSSHPTQHHTQTD